MATRTTRLTRLNDRKVERQQQLITFEIRGVSFLMPIEAVNRAIVFDHNCHPLKYINFERDILPVVLVDRHIFNRMEAQTSSSKKTQQQIALIIEALPGFSSEQGQRITLPIDSPPSLCRISESDLLPLPKTYEVKCVDGMTKADAAHPLQFLLNPNQLVASQTVAQLSPQNQAKLMTSDNMVIAQPLGI